MSSKSDLIRDEIKKQSARGGSGPRVNRMLWAKDGESYKVRFLHEIEDCSSVAFYNSFKEGVNVFGPENWDGEEENKRFLKAMKSLKIKPTTQHVFLVWNYEEECVQILLMKAVPSSFLMGIVDWEGQFGTICDKDYILKRMGTGPGTSYSVMPDMKSSSGIPKKALEAYKEFNHKNAMETLRLVHKIPDEYVSDEELEEREAKRAEREERKKEFEGKKSIKDRMDKKKGSSGDSPWNKKSSDSEEDKAYFKRKEELDSFEDEEDE